MEYMVRLHFPASNNASEYEALINDLWIAVKLGIKRLEIRGDSELVLDQVMKDRNCVDPKMAAYCQAVEICRANSTASSCITCCTTTTKQPTYSRRLHLVKARFLTGSSRVISMRHPYE
jgi:ribonuclease HI